jgi:hypothetical protein
MKFLLEYNAHNYYTKKEIDTTIGVNITVHFVKHVYQRLLNDRQDITVVEVKNLVYKSLKYILYFSSITNFNMNDRIVIIDRDNSNLHLPVGINKVSDGSLEIYVYTAMKEKDFKMRAWQNVLVHSNGTFKAGRINPTTKEIDFYIDRFNK